MPFLTFDVFDYEEIGLGNDGELLVVDFLVDVIALGVSCDVVGVTVVAVDFFELLASVYFLEEVVIDGEHLVGVVLLDNELVFVKASLALLAAHFNN